jgi:uncharacterized protein YsxB (DUF464 family)
LILITRTPNSITVCGHAGYAEHGKDIVCSAVSTLTQTLIASLNELTKDEFDYKAEAGNVNIVFEKDLTERGQLLVESFLLGIGGVAAAYPDNVKLSEHL